MIQRILLATDGSESAAQAERMLGSFHFSEGAVVQVICVVDAFVEKVMEPMQPGQRDRVRQLVDEAVARLQGQGFTASGAVRVGDADHQLLVAARELDADLIVLGSRGLSGLEGFLLGSVARNVAQQAACSVLVVRGTQTLPGPIILAADESRSAAKAVEMVAALPLPAGAIVTVLNVVRTAHPFLDLLPLRNETLHAQLRTEEQRRKASGEQLVLGSSARLAAAGVQCRVVVRGGDPAAEILAAANNVGACLIVAGARGMSLIEGLVLGSVAERLLKGASCSVLLVR